MRSVRCVRFLFTQPLGSRQIAKYYGCCDTMFVHPNHLGSTTMITNAAGTVMRDLVFYPYGQTWRNIGNNWDLHFAGMWQREFASGLDPTLNRLYHSRLFRWMTPDEFTGGPTDAVNASVGGPDPTPPGPLPYADITNPQSLNKYAYVYNNPLRYTDPTGRVCWKAIFGGKCADDPPPPPSTVKPPEGEKGKRSRPVVQGKPEKIDKGRRAASRQVEYRVVDANGNRVTRGQQVRLDEKFLSGKGNADICNGPGGCTDTDGLVDEQGVLVGMPFTVERKWQVGKQPAGVRDPKTGNVYDYEVNNNDYDANPPIQTEYHNDE
jgi:hypothetical protein